MLKNKVFHSSLLELSYLQMYIIIIIIIISSSSTHTQWIFQVTLVRVLV